MNDVFRNSPTQPHDLERFDRPASISGKLAVFDLCGTVYDCNLLFSFVRQQPECSFWRNIADSFPIKATDKALPMFQLRRTIYAKALNKLPSNEVRARAQDFAGLFLPQRTRAPIAAKIDELRNEGYEIAFISAAPEFIAECAAEHFDAARFFAAKIIGGKIVDDPMGRKSEYLKLLPPYSQLFVCTDNRSDVDLLDAANDYLIVCRDKDITWWRKRYPAEKILIVQ